MKNIILIMLLISSVTYALAQDCEVLLEELKGEYEGDCKKGKAHGEGVATGNEFTYKGAFKKGLPDGKGELRLMNGDVFKGEFDAGMIKGYGELNSENGEKKGYWKGSMSDFIWMGEEKTDLAGYKILADDNLDQAQVRISKSDNSVNAITVRLSDAKNQSINGISFEERNSGQVVKSTNTNSRSFIELSAVSYPFVGTLRYNVSNQSGNFSLPVILKISIHEPGDWTISITH